uniref:AIR synthase related protein n=1 Tax=Escherichia coli TaxID=562 RepID=UPI0034D183B3
SLMSRPSEDQLIARYLAPLATAPGADGLTDDAAVLPEGAGDLVVTKDMLVAGVHFFADDPPGMVARKALRVNLSDLA